MTERFKLSPGKAMPVRLKEALNIMVESAATPSKPYEAKADAGGYVIHRPDRSPVATVSGDKNAGQSGRFVFHKR
jgi:hypothetical protein